MSLRLLSISAGIAMAIAFLALQVGSTATQRVSADEEIARQPVRPAQTAGEDHGSKRAIILSHEAEAATQAALMPAGVQSILVIGKTLRHGEFVWNEHNVPQGRVQVWVDLRRQTISVFRAGHEVGSAIIAYGADEKQTPMGKFEILSKHRHYRSRSYGADMPYSLFITKDGIALHSSFLKPRHATHGCVGLPDEFARRLFDIADVGASVQITRSDPDVLEGFVTPA